MTKKIRAAQAGLRKGQSVADGSLTVGAFLDEWLETSAKPTVRSSNYHAYESQVRVHLEPALGHIPLATLRPQDVHAFINAKAEAGMHSSTISRIRAALRRALNQAMKWDLISRNVATLVEVPSAPRFRVEPMTLAQAQQLLEAATGDRLEALYALVLAVRLRSGEVRALQWEDVDLDAGMIATLHTLQRSGGGFRLAEPKSESSRRDLPVPEFVVALLREHQDRQRREREKAGDDWEDWGLVFTTGRGTPIDAANLLHQFHRLL